MFRVSTAIRARRSGFTLQELLCVLAFVIVALLCSRSFVRSHPQSYKSAARSSIVMLEYAVKLYAEDVGACPTTSQGLSAIISAPSGSAAQTWKGPYLDKARLPIDPWNNAYRYEANSDKQFRVWSLGPDGLSGTADDIST